MTGWLNWIEHYSGKNLTHYWKQILIFLVSYKNDHILRVRPAIMRMHNIFLKCKILLHCNNVNQILQFYIIFTRVMHNCYELSSQSHRTLCHDGLFCICPVHYLSSVQFSHSVMSNSLRLHEPQHARPPCPSPTPGVYSNSCPSSRWCHPTISSSVIHFSSCPQSFPALGSFPMSQHFALGGTKVLEFQLQHQSFQWTPRTDLL